MATTTINWFPGHMRKTQREIKENLKLVEAVIEIRDARIPRSSANPDIEKLCGNKPRLILLNKSDLTESRVTREWMKELSKDNVKAIEVNCLKGKGLNQIKPALEELLKEKLERYKAKGLVNVVIRVMVVGIPNVGKSTFINKMAKNNIAKTGDRPGVTKSKQWIKTPLGIEMLDTPGVLWPKFEDERTALNLAFTGAIKDEIMDTEELSYRLVERLQKHYANELMARKRGCLMSGGHIDYNRIAVILLDEFRGGKIGNISLERVDDVLDEEENEGEV